MSGVIPIYETVPGATTAPGHRVQCASSLSSRIKSTTQRTIRQGLRNPISSPINWVNPNRQARSVLDHQVPTASRACHPHGVTSDLVQYIIPRSIATHNPRRHSWGHTKGAVRPHEIVVPEMQSIRHELGLDRFVEILYNTNRTGSDLNTVGGLSILSRVVAATRLVYTCSITFHLVWRLLPCRLNSTPSFFCRCALKPFGLSSKSSFLRSRLLISPLLSHRPELLITWTTLSLVVSLEPLSEPPGRDNCSWEPPCTIRSIFFRRAS